MDQVLIERLKQQYGRFDQINFAAIATHMLGLNDWHGRHVVGNLHSAPQVVLERS